MREFPGSITVAGENRGTGPELRIGSRTDLKGTYLRLEFRDQSISSGVTDRNGDRDCHATLASRSICCTHERVGSFIEIGVRHDDHVILGAAESLASLSSPGRG